MPKGQDAAEQRRRPVALADHSGPSPLTLSGGRQPRPDATPDAKSRGDDRRRTHPHRTDPLRSRPRTTTPERTRHGRRRSTPGGCRPNGADHRSHRPTPQHPSRCRDRHRRHDRQHPRRPRHPRRPDDHRDHRRRDPSRDRPRRPREPASSLPTVRRVHDDDRRRPSRCVRSRSPAAVADAAAGPGPPRRDGSARPRQRAR